MSWDKYIKRYVWDDNKTPYFVAVPKLTRSQADHEIFSYALFLAILFGVISFLSLTDNAPHGRSPGVALYAITVSGSAVLFGVTKHLYAAYYFAMAPVATLAYFVFIGFPPNLATIDKLVLVIAALVLLRYSLRVVAIAKRYPDMPGDAPAG